MKRLNRNILIKPLILLFLLLTLPTSFLWGQEEDINKQIWMDVNPRVVLGTGKVLLYGNLGYRTIFHQSSNRYFLNIGVNYSPFIYRENSSTPLQYLQFHAGIGDYFTASQVQESFNEIRTFQGVRLYWPNLKRARFSHYLRFEQRWERVMDTFDYEYSSRIRYKLSVKFRFTKPALTDLYLPISTEIFLNGEPGHYFNDVTRLTPGIGFDFTDQLASEFHISYHFSRNSNSLSFLNNELVFRLRTFYTF